MYAFDRRKNFTPESISATIENILEKENPDGQRIDKENVDIDSIRETLKKTNTGNSGKIDTAKSEDLYEMGSDELLRKMSSIKKKGDDFAVIEIMSIKRDYKIHRK